MSGALKALRLAVVERLNARGIRAVAAFQPEGEKKWSGPVAAVSLSKVACQPGTFRRYLGLREDGASGERREVYGQAVELTLSMDIYGPGDGGEDACRELLEELAEALALSDWPEAAFQSMESGEMEFLAGRGLYRLPVACCCRAWLTAEVREDGEVVDILVKGRKT